MSAPRAACLVLSIASCAAPGGPTAPDASPSAGDPSAEHVSLPCADGWEASVVLDDEVGVWDVRALPVFGRYGCPQVVGMDDLGRLVVLISYSGKWTPRWAVHDGLWLGPVAHADLDPRAERAELYTGGQRGVLYQVRPEAYGASDVRRLASFPGEEIHTLASGDLDPATPGEELWVFTHAEPEDAPGRLRSLRWVGAAGGGAVPGGPADAAGPADATAAGWRVDELAALEGRVRDAIVLDEPDWPRAPGGAPWVLVCGRTGELALLAHDGAGGLLRATLLREPMGLGRIDVARRTDGALVVYTGRDDGLVLRAVGPLPGGDRAPTLAPLPADGDDDGRSRVHGPAPGWSREVLYAGPRGLRGIAAGRFDDDPATETVAVFGYGARVELLTRRGDGPWTVSPLFTDVDKGHWLTTAELDGRNGTHELLCTGYSGRIVLLSRPAGYGMEGSPADDRRR